MKTMATPDQLKKWEQKYGRKLKKSELVFELERAPALAILAAKQKAEQEAANARAEAAARVAVPATPTAAQLAFDAASTDAQAEQRAAYLAAGYVEVERPEDVRRMEREIERKHDD